MQRWKGDSVENLYVVELEVKPGPGVPTRRGENGPVYDPDLERNLPGGVIQHELHDKLEAADNLEVKAIRQLQSETDD